MKYALMTLLAALVTTTQPAFAAETHCYSDTGLLVLDSYFNAQQAALQWEGQPEVVFTAKRVGNEPGILFQKYEYVLSGPAEALLTVTASPVASRGGCGRGGCHRLDINAQLTQGDVVTEFSCDQQIEF